MGSAHFSDRLLAAIAAKQTPLVVGLDPVYENLPPVLKPGGGREAPTLGAAVAAIAAFSQTILRIVAAHVPAVKINSAYFERYGGAGVKLYGELVQQASQLGLLVIGDVKRADIGHTAEQYAEGNLADAELGGVQLRGPDAVTVNPYFGGDGIKPFITVARRQQKGVFVLLRTSNPTAGEVQDIAAADGRPLYRHVADLIERWGRDLMGGDGFSDIGAVVGATSGGAIAELRQALPHTLFLIPGVGTQGGSLADCASAFRNGAGAVLNVSRAIIFAYRQRAYENGAAGDWTEAVRQATLQTKAQMAQALGGGDGYRTAEPPRQLNIGPHTQRE